MKTVLISNEQNLNGLQAGGNDQRIIPVPVEVPDLIHHLIEEFGWEDKFVFMHQRNDNHIFSPMPLDAYDEIQSDDTAFLILGGSANHRKQAKDYQLKK